MSHAELMPEKFVFEATHPTKRDAMCLLLLEDSERGKMTHRPLQSIFDGLDPESLSKDWPLKLTRQRSACGLALFSLSDLSPAYAGPTCPECRAR